jgi:geranylgeranyl pyrophosphate synthase
LFGLSQSEELRALYAHPNGLALSSSNGNEDYVYQVVSLLEESGARDFANEKATEYSRGALDHLEAAQPAGAASNALYQLTEMLLARSH